MINGTDIYLVIFLYWVIGWARSMYGGQTRSRSGSGAWQPLCWRWGSVVGGRVRWLGLRGRAEKKRTRDHIRVSTGEENRREERQSTDRSSKIGRRYKRERMREIKKAEGSDSND